MARNGKSPQQKKRESYLHDRRKVFGNSDKAARKAGPPPRAVQNGAERRVEKQVLSGPRAVTTSSGLTRPRLATNWFGVRAGRKRPIHHSGGL